MKTAPTHQRVNQTWVELSKPWSTFQNVSPEGMGKLVSPSPFSWQKLSEAPCPGPKSSIGIHYSCYILGPEPRLDESLAARSCVAICSKAVSACVDCDPQITQSAKKPVLLLIGGVGVGPSNSDSSLTQRGHPLYQ